MKKLPCPAVLISNDPGVVILEWDWISLQMYDDQARLLARSIYDALEEQPPETDGGPLSPWGET